MGVDQLPRVWVLEGHRKGDNAQARELARLLGWPLVIKKLTWTAAHVIPNLLLGASLFSLDRKHSDPLAPPWPDVVIAVGKRSVPVSRWIKAKSGGKSRLIHIGRPRAPLNWFDLVITTPQYGLPAAENVCELPLPLVPPIDVDAGEIARWQAAFAALPRPWTGVLIGGNRYPSVFGKKEVARLVHSLETQPGSALISTSPRTGAAAAAELRKRTSTRSYLHDWTKGGPNPHQAILVLADRFIVTSDSVSMIAEAFATKKPVEIFQTGRAPFAFTWSARSGLAAWLARNGLLAPPRSLDRIGIPEQPPSSDDLVHRIRKLAGFDK